MAQEILTGKVEVKDYPYGRLRTSMFYSVEYVKGKGYRSVRQTINPKTGRLNKEKKSTYSEFMYMYRDAETGYVKFAGYTPNSMETYVDTLRIIENQKINLTPTQKEDLFASLLNYFKVSAISAVQYKYGTFQMSSETPDAKKEIELIQENSTNVFKFLIIKWGFSDAMKVYKANGSVKEMLKAVTPKEYTRTEMYNLVKSGEVAEVVKTSTALESKKSAPKKLAKKAAVKKAVAKKAIKTKTVKMKKYKLGDKWSEDFDYDGMMVEAKKVSLKSGTKAMRKLHSSLEDVNYHTLAGALWSLIQTIENGAKVPQSKKDLAFFQQEVDRELGVDIKKRNSKSNSKNQKSNKMAKKTAPKGTSKSTSKGTSKSTSKRLEDLKKGNDREKLLYASKIIVKQMKKETPDKSKALANKASYISNGLKGTKGSKSDIAEAKEKTKAVWGSVRDSIRLSDEGKKVTTTKKVKDHFDYLVKTFGVKVQTKKSKLSNVPEELF